MSEHEGGGSRRPRRRWRWLFLFAFLLLIAVGYFAPTIIAITPPLRAVAISMVSDALEVNVNCRSLSLGWFSPVRVDGVSVLDADQKSVVTVERLTVEQSLWRVLSNPQQLGTIRIDKPLVRLAVGDGGSNLEKVFAPLLKPSDKPSSLGPLEVQVRDGRIDIARDDADPFWSLRDLTADVKARTEQNAPVIEVTWEGNAHEGGSEGHLQCSLSLEAGKGRARLMTEQASLSIVDAIGRRFGVELNLTGRLTSKIDASWDEQGQTVEVHSLTCDQPTVAAPWLGQQRLESAELRLSGRAQIIGKEVTVQQGSVVVDWADLDFDGRIGVDELLAALDEQRWLDAPVAGQYVAKGKVDLAGFAAAMPQILRLHEGVRIERGLANFELRSEQLESGGQRLDASLETSELLADRQGQRIHWRQPIKVRVDARRSKQNWSVSQARWQSEHLSIEGGGDDASGSLTAEGDLERLREQLAQLVDLGRLQFGGAFSGGLKWEAGGQRGHLVEADCELNRFHFSSPHTRPISEQRLTLDGKVLADGFDPTTWRVDHLTVTAGQDRLVLQPVAAAAGDEDTAMNIRATGDLSRWAARLQAIAPLDGWRLAGRIDLRATARWGDNNYEITDSATELHEAVVVGPGFALDEPHVIAQIAGRWDNQARSWKSSKVVLQSTSLSLATNDLTVIQSAGGGWTAQGNAGVRGDWARLWRIADPDSKTTARLAGQFSGQVQMSREATRWAMTLSTKHQDFQVAMRPPREAGVRTVSRANAGAWPIVWEEPNLVVDSQVVYDTATRRLHVEGLETSADWLRLAARGEVRSPGEPDCSVDLKGEVSYDWSKALPRLRPLLGEGIELRGADTREFYVRANLADVASESPLRRLLAGASIGWTQAHVHGFETGPGDVRARLENGVVHVEPMDLGVGRGRILLSPNIDLNPASPLLTLRDGDGMQQIEISPEMCRGWLKFVAPLLADATDAQGRLSMSLRKAQLPLDHPKRASIDGTLLVHSAQVGPGPTMLGFLGIVDQLAALTGNTGAIGTKAWIRMPEQQVGVRMEKGRVYHRDLIMQVRDLQIRTTGSVGVDDETLDLTAEFPILDRWVEGKRYLDGFRGQKIPVRIRGTFKNPKFDASALRRIPKASIKGAAEKLLRDELNRGLQKLFGPR